MRAHRTCPIQCKPSLQIHTTRRIVLTGPAMLLRTNMLVRSRKDPRTMKLHPCSNSKVTSPLLSSHMETDPRSLQHTLTWAHRTSFPISRFRPVPPLTRYRLSPRSPSPGHFPCRSQPQARSTPLHMDTCSLHHSLRSTQVMASSLMHRSRSNLQCSTAMKVPADPTR